MVHFVGAGSGAADLITVRGAKLLSEADTVIYAGSLVNPELVSLTKDGCENLSSPTPRSIEDIEAFYPADNKLQTPIMDIIMENDGILDCEKTYDNSK